jgi:hypothetical protein
MTTKLIAAALFAAMISTPALACAPGDQELKVLADFKLFKDVEAVKAYVKGYHSGDPLGEFTPGGIVCMSHSNTSSPKVLAYLKSHGHGFEGNAPYILIYFKSHGRDFTGVAPLDSFEEPK